MRVSTAYQFEAFRSRSEKTGAAYFDAQMKVTTGKRINNYSDDPFGMNSIVSMRSLKSGIDQYSKNIDRAKGFVGRSESVLSEMNTLLTRANALTVSGGTATASQEQRRAMAQEVASIRDRVLNLSNSKSANGDYMFSGTAIDIQPFQLSATGIVYQGNTGQLRVESAPGQQTVISVDASTLFTDLYTDLDTLKQALESGDTSQLTGQLLTDMQNATKSVNAIRGDLGVRLRDVETIQNDHLRRQEELTGNISDIEDVDLSKAIMDYKSAETAYQAALQVASQGFRMSLMDYIRG
jgi:flagellar hook-associated protein 3 FlgL